MKKIFSILAALGLSLAVSVGAMAATLELGDANGDGKHSADDCSEIIYYVLCPSLSNMTDEQIAVCDVDGSGKITSNDAAFVLRKIIDSDFQFITTESTTGAEKDTTTEATTEAVTDDTTETTTENTDISVSDAYYIALSDGATKVYEYKDGTIGSEALSQSAVVVIGDVISIDSAGTYYAAGTLTDGQISVSDNLTKSDKVEIHLMGVDVTSSATAPFNGGGAKITLCLEDGTTNTFTDNSTAAYSDYITSSAPKGAFYSKRDLTIDESGTLVVDGSYSNGIVCGADLTIKGGANVTVTAVKNGIKGDNSVSVGKKAGTINVTSGGDGIKSDAISSAKFVTSDGSQLSAKADGIEDGKGYVEIKGGDITINATGDGIQADNYFTMTNGSLNITADEKGIKANEALLYVIAEDADGNECLTYDSDGNAVTLNGSITISGGTAVISSAEDCLRACEELTINDGELTLTASTASDGTASDAIQVGKSTDTVTENSDGSTLEVKEINVKGDIKILGGTVNVISAADDAIVSNGDLTMSAGTVGGSATNDFFKVYDNFVVTGGTVDITSGCDGVQAGKALTVLTSSSGTETESDYTDGNVTISGGSFTITANGGTSNTSVSDSSPSCKGIKANTELVISGGEFNINSADDAIHSNYNATITGGTLELATLDDGIHADYTLNMGTSGGADSDFTANITTSYEGIEGSVINVLSGTTYVYSTDDGINAAGYYDTDGTYYENGSSSGNNGNMWGGGGQMTDDTAPYGMLYIKGGCVYVLAPNGDGMDSNGCVEMSGGTVIVNGPSSNTANDVFDYGDSNSDYFKVTGGTLIGAGYNMASVNLTVSGQGSATTSGRNSGMGGMGGRPGQSGSSSSGSAGTPVKVTTDSGNIVFVPQTNWSYMFISTPDMSQNGSYSISTVSSYSGGTNVLGVTDNGTYYGLVENVN